MNIPAASWFSSPTLPRILPFLVYIFFIAPAEIGDLAGLLSVTPEMLTLLYPVKILCTILALAWCLPRCTELSFAHFRVSKDTALAVLVGLFVFAFWIHLDGDWISRENTMPFAPDAAGDGIPRVALLICRLMGAALVVPLMEELFWRSWAIRFLVYRDFLKVPLNQFNCYAFFAINVLFALEHHLVLAGFLAGAAYTLVLYRTNSVSQCVLAHSVTNAALGLWVMATGNWEFW